MHFRCHLLLDQTCQASSLLNHGSWMCGIGEAQQSLLFFFFLIIGHGKTAIRSSAKLGP